MHPKFMTGRRSLIASGVAAVASFVMPALSAAQPSSTGAGAGQTVAIAESATVARVLKAQFDRPDAPLQVEPVTVWREHALAGWAQGARGGRALLHRHADHWQIVACGGDGLLDAEVLASTGMPPEAAEALARAHAAAETRLPPSLLAQFASFDGLLHLDGVAHPHTDTTAPVHTHHAPHGAAPTASHAASAAGVAPHSAH